MEHEFSHQKTRRMKTNDTKKMKQTIQNQSCDSDNEITTNNE